MSRHEIALAIIMVVLWFGALTAHLRIDALERKLRDKGHD